MFPVYPLIALAAALAMSDAAALAARLVPIGTLGRRALLALMLCVCAGAGAMRAAGQARYYGAPLRLYAALSASDLHVYGAGERLVVCVGNEWYRFPSSFFLPPRARLAFVKDGFGGQLPAHYSAPWPAGSRAVHAHFNGLNREEPSRYVPLHTCDVLVDLLPTAGAADERERRALHRGRRAWRTWPFLDAARSPSWSRAVYIPALSARRNAYGSYVVLQR